jgi:hypothetical protein
MLTLAQFLRRSALEVLLVTNDTDVVFALPTCLIGTRSFGSIHNVEAEIDACDSKENDNENLDCEVEDIEAHFGEVPWRRAAEWNWGQPRGNAAEDGSD